MSLAAREVSRQLALPFPHSPHYDVDDFCADASNEAALRWLDRTAAWPGGQLALWGEEGRGKTHLLHRWARRHQAAIIDGPSLRGLAARPVTAVAIDDADAVTDEAALLHLLNAAQEAGLPVVLAGRSPPARWHVRLPDLSSRLRAMTAVGLAAPEDELLRLLFSRLLLARQLVVAEAVQDWLRLRLPRSAAALREAACRLDHAALAAGGRISRTTAAVILSEMRGWDPDLDPADDVSTSPHPSIWPESARVTSIVG